MRRARLIILYCFLLGGSGWFWYSTLPFVGASVATLVLFGSFALIADLLGFRTPPTDPASLSGVILLAAALALDPSAAALIAGIEGLLFGVLRPFLHHRPRSVYTLAARPILRSGARMLGILGGFALAEWLYATITPSALNGQRSPISTAILLASLIVSYTLVTQGVRFGRELLQGGVSGVQTWWRATWNMSLWTEVAPLPLALLLASIYTDLGSGYFILAGAGIVGVSVGVRRTALNLQHQRRSMRELALLNEISRAIIRSELNVEALCELIYREASKIVDTSSFHLGLFDGDAYTLHVHIQDRVRLPPLTVHLEVGDGIIGWMRQTGRTLLVEDFLVEMERLPARPRYQSQHPPRSGIYVPLIVGDAVIGSISVQSYQPGAFDANDLRLLSLIADQTAVTVMRARDFNDAQQRAIQLQAIHEVSEQVTAILNLEELLPSVVQLIREHFHYHPIHIFTVEPDQRIVFRTSTADAATIEALRARALRFGEGIVGNAAQNSQPVVVGDVLSDTRYIRDTQATRSEMAAPLRIGDHVIGVLDVQSHTPQAFDAEDLFVVQTLADQIAIAIDSANSYAAQQEEAWTLNALLQVAENTGRATALDELLPTIVRLPPLLVGCDRCFCLQWDHEYAQFELLAAYGLSRDQRDRLLGQRIACAEAPLLTRAYASRRREVLVDARNRPDECPSIIRACQSGTLAALPLLAHANLLGILLLDYNAAAYAPSNRHLALYGGMATQIAGALESVLLAREAAEAARMEQELRVAREIQTSLLPASPPRILGWDIAADWRSARLVGGDFYDFWVLPMPGEQQPTPMLGLVIADVSDKGVPAAMFMALSRSLVRAAALDGSAPDRALNRANRWIARDSESGMFVTIFYALLDTHTGRLRYARGGHNPPLVYHAASGRIEELFAPGIALGVLDEIVLTEAQIHLAPGDLLVCYTDGVTEATDDCEEEFGVERLHSLIAAHHADSADEILQTITAAVAEFTGGQPPFDDVTLVVLKRLAE